MSTSKQATGKWGASQRERERAFWRRFQWKRIRMPSDGLIKRSLVPRRAYVLARRGNRG